MKVNNTEHSSTTKMQIKQQIMRHQIKEQEKKQNGNHLRRKDTPAGR